MATLYITEFARQPLDGFSNPAPVAQVPPMADNAIAITAASTQSGSFTGSTTMVRVTSDVVCSIAFGSNPTATASSMRISASTPEYFGVPVNSNLKLAVIANT